MSFCKKYSKIHFSPQIIISTKKKVCMVPQSCCDGSRYMVSEGSECEKFKIVLESMEWLNSFSDSL